MKPHVYWFHGEWWLSRNGRESFRMGITLNDTPLYGRPGRSPR